MSETLGKHLTHMNHLSSIIWYDKCLTRLKCLDLFPLIYINVVRFLMMDNMLIAMMSVCMDWLSDQGEIDRWGVLRNHETVSESATKGSSWDASASKNMFKRTYFKEENYVLGGRICEREKIFWRLSVVLLPGCLSYPVPPCHLPALK